MFQPVDMLMQVLIVEKRIKPQPIQNKKKSKYYPNKLQKGKSSARNNEYHTIQYSQMLQQ